MLPILDALTREINSINMDDFDDPTASYSLQANDHQCGIVSDELRQVYMLGQLYQQRAKIAAATALLAPKKGSSEQAKQEAHEYESKADLLRELFWYTVKDMYGLWGKSVGMRTGWTVVWMEMPKMPPKGSSFEELMRRIIGPNPSD